MKQVLCCLVLIVFSLQNSFSQSLTEYEFEKHLNQYKHDQAVSSAWLWINVTTLLLGVVATTVGTTLQGSNMGSDPLQKGLNYGGYGLAGVSVIGLITSLATLNNANKNYIETLRLQQNYYNLLNYRFDEDESQK